MIIKKSSKIAVIIPVRMGSKRLPNKNILPIKNIPMFVFVARNVMKSKFNLNILLAQSPKKLEIFVIKVILII